MAKKRENKYIKLKCYWIFKSNNHLEYVGTENGITYVHLSNTDTKCKTSIIILQPTNKIRRMLNSALRVLELRNQEMKILKYNILKNTTSFIN